MKYIKYILFAVIYLPAALLKAQTALTDTTLAGLASVPAKERFAGLHLDFHSTLDDREIGKNFTYAMIDSMLSIIQPDFIQVDCKGHPGVSSYPTKVGNTVDTFDKDILKIWRQVTYKHHVPLYIHYSGIWDKQILKLNPAWGRVNAEGKYDMQAVSLASPYSRELMIPQLKELESRYHIDGAWVDGDCWGLEPDYSPDVQAGFTKETHFKVPHKFTDPYYFEWMEYNRRLFRDYMAGFVNAVHQTNPAFKITSNWAFSSMMPERVDIDVDFLSGDIAGINSVYSAAFEARCLALQGKPWDLMSWAFAMKNDLNTTKPLLQLKQEAAEVLAMGGGYQTYWQQNRDGSPQPHLFREMADIVRFSNERKKFCFKGEIVPQVGLLYATYSWKRILTDKLYTAHGQDNIKGILNMLLNSQLPVEILMDHQLVIGLEKYPVIVLPEWEHLDPVINDQLINYVIKGGNLLVIGAEASGDFAEQLGVKMDSIIQKNTAVYAGFNNQILGFKTDFRWVQPVAATLTKGIRLTANDWRFKSSNPIATICSLGKGKIAGVYMNIGNFYNQNKNPLLPALLAYLIKTMQPDLLSSISGSSSVHQVISRKNGKLYIHLINVSGPHDNPNVLVYDEVKPLQNLTVNLSLQHAPKSVRLQPESTKLNFSYKNGKVTVEIPQLSIYSIIEVEY